ncbi:hypothetical protein [Nonlabens ulvanivorans]|uniref:hypothetical protein n=1 Tax=Nonlabens ulvanivorans TaxID=906888 RepID=UPI002943CE03|nr:hypothetical protein [Nonlabens ulvanivorans]WOI24183.1 hypothetical protein R1T42_06950 [Nonlabens ulvanivorans]
MRNWTLIFILILFSSCKNNNNSSEGEIDDSDFINEVKTNAPITEADLTMRKVLFYEEMIRTEFKDVIEAHKIRSKANSINMIFKENAPFKIPHGSVFKYIELHSIEKPDQEYPADQMNYEFYYHYTKVFRDTVNLKDIKTNGFIAIDEQPQVIDNDTINSVKIIW